MKFGKNEVREILKAAGVENVSLEAIKEIVELHQEVQDQSIANELEKNKPEDSQEFKDLKTKLEAAEEKQSTAEKDLETYKKQNPNAANPKDSEEFKALQQEFEDYKTGIEEQKVSATISGIKKKALEELGLKGSALELILKADDTKIELDKDGKASEEVIANFTKTISEGHKDLIETVKGSGGANPLTPPGGKNPPAKSEGIGAALSEHYK